MVAQDKMLGSEQSPSRLLELVILHERKVA